MNIWLDAQLSPAIALWINQNFASFEACSLRSIGLLYATDVEIFRRAKGERVVLMTKDDDFVNLLRQFGPPPSILLITCGNSSNERMRTILEAHLAKAMALIASGEALVEISG